MPYGTNAPGYGDHEDFHIPDKIGFETGYKVNKYSGGKMWSGIRNTYEWKQGVELVAHCDKSDNAMPMMPPKPEKPTVAFKPPAPPPGLFIPRKGGSFETEITAGSGGSARDIKIGAQVGVPAIYGDPADSLVTDRERAKIQEQHAEAVAVALEFNKLDIRAKVAKEYPGMIRAWEKRVKDWKRLITQIEAGNNPHKAPVDNCTCGFYCSRSMKEVIHYNQWENEGVIVEVAMWGKVIRGTKGFRAQIIYPQRFWLFCEDKKNPQTLARKDSLEKEWGLEVRLLEKWMFESVKKDLAPE